MTREEAIATIKELMIACAPYSKYYIVGDMAIEALKQQPCGDCVSRQAVLDYIDKMPSELTSDGRRMVRRRTLEEYISDTLPPVTPQPKTVLYSGDGYADGYMVYDMAECPNCGYEYEDGDKDWGLPFCPGCGQSLNWESEEV